MATYNGWEIVTMPDTPSVRSIEFAVNQIIGSTTSPFTGQQQIQDWQSRWMEASIALPPMTSLQAAAWIAFLMACRGTASVFLLPPVLAAIVPSGGVPGGYWRLKSNQNKYSLVSTHLFGFDFEIREAI